MCILTICHRGKKKLSLIPSYPHLQIEQLSQTYFQEWLYLGALLECGLVHPLGDLTRIPINTSYQSMSILFISSSIIIGFDDYSFSACVPATEDQYYFPCFHNFPHFGDVSVKEQD